MSNKDVIIAFLEHKQAKTPLRYIINGYYGYKGRTLQSISDTLINYNTVIAYFKDDILYLNKNKYSVTTSKIQSKLNYLASTYNYKVVYYE